MIATHHQGPLAYRRISWRLICLALAFAGVQTRAFAGSDAASSPSVQSLLNAPTPIEETNATNLRLAWSTNISRDGQRKASTIIRNGTMYLTAPRVASEASDRKVRRQTPFKPNYVLLYVVSRNVPGCPDTSNGFDSMAALYTNALVVLDVSAPTPKIRRYYKMVRSDSPDDDAAMITDHAKMRRPKQGLARVYVGSPGLTWKVDLERAMGIEPAGPGAPRR
jgi:hypothetical protein